MMEKSLNSIRDNLARIREEIAGAAIKAGRDPEEVALMAVTKTQSVQAVNEAIAHGATLLGENRAQELCERYDGYNRKGCDIHFIGHLQTNKVKQVVGKVSTVQSVDSLKLAREISRQSEKCGVTTRLLIEVNIGGEQSKAGAAPAGIEELVRQIALLPAVQVHGLMAIPPIYDNSAAHERYFADMHALKVDIMAKNIDNVHMHTLSMGMSDDFAIAIKHGSTMVRLGTAIFGVRETH